MKEKMTSKEEEKIRENIWNELIKSEEYRNYGKSGRFYIKEFPIIFRICMKEFKKAKLKEIGK